VVQADAGIHRAGRVVTRPEENQHACRYCGRTGRFYREEPRGYVEWHEWAERMGRTHEQHPCPGCSRLTVWRLK